jgi:hypothetical protein
MITDYSEKELLMLRSLGISNMLFEKLSILDTYKAAIEHVFLYKKTGAAVDSLRRCWQAICICSFPRNTEEFDKLIQLDFVEEEKGVTKVSDKLLDEFMVWIHEIIQYSYALKIAFHCDGFPLKVVIENHPEVLCGCPIEDETIDAFENQPIRYIGDRLVSKLLCGCPIFIW